MDSENIRNTAEFEMGYTQGHSEGFAIGSIPNIEREIRTARPASMLLPDEITAALSRLAEYEALRPDVLTFAKAMEAVLRKHDDRPGWEREPYGYLSSRLEAEFYEFLSADRAGDARGMKHEAVDIANFCMMLFCNIERDEAAAAMEKGEGET